MSHCAVQERRGFARRVALERIASRQPEIPRRAQVISGAVKVTREIRRRFVFASAEYAFHGEARARMRIDARPGCHLLEHNFLIEPVRKAIQRTEDPVGHLDDAFADDEGAATGEYVEHRFQGKLVDVGRARREPERELDAHDRCGVDSLTFIGRQLVDLATSQNQSTTGGFSIPATFMRVTVSV